MSPNNLTLKLALEEDREDYVRMCHSFFSASPFNDMTFSREKIDAIFDIYLADKTKAMVILLCDETKNVGVIVGYAESPLFAKEEIASELAWWVDEEYRNTRKSGDLVAALEDWAIRIGVFAVNMASITGFSPESVNRYYVKRGYTNVENSYLRKI